jgi:hypothetical protein
MTQMIRIAAIQLDKRSSSLGVRPSICVEVIVAGTIEKPNFSGAQKRGRICTAVSYTKRRRDLCDPVALIAGLAP